MRLIRFGDPGKEKPGLLNNGKIVDLTRHFPNIPDIGPEFFSQGWLKKARQVQDPGVESSARLGCPITRPEKIICLGKNYADHAREGNMDIPAAPLLFCKTANALNGPFDPILMPRFSGQVDWEVELAVILGKAGKVIAQEHAMDYVAGFAIMNDVSGRQAQFGDKQWFRGKSFDSFAPLGPAIVTPDELGDISRLELLTLVNGQVMQHGKTCDLLFNVPRLIAFISQDITLSPGDIISTGTPSGVGVFRDPPLFLNAGDVVECRITGIGALKNTVVRQNGLS